MLEELVERFNPHLLDSGLNQLPDAIVNHRSGHAGRKAETVCEVGCDVVLTTRDVNLEIPRFAKRDDPWIKSMNQCSKGEEIQSASIIANREFSHV
jgi:hypothetical protein